MYVGTDKVFGQGVTLGEEPDPAAMRAQQELMERRRKLLEQRKYSKRKKKSAKLTNAIWSCLNGANLRKA
jgi:hypothetical protein